MLISLIFLWRDCHFHASRSRDDLRVQTRRVRHKVDSHDAEHQDRVKDVECPLVLQRVAVRSHDVLDDPEDGPDHDERADEVQHHQEALPGKLRRGRARVAAVAGRDDALGAVAQVEDDRGDPEQAEPDDLDDEAGDDDVLARLHAAVLDHEACSAGLHKEGEDIADDEYCCEPARADERARLAAGECADDSAEDHVNRRGVQGRCDEEEHGLKHIGNELVGFVMCDGSEDVSYGLD